jgi:hypothetical protein
MRTLKLLALGVLLAMSAALPVNAQTPPADESRFFLNITLGGQWKEQTFTDSSSFTIYAEPTGAVAAAHSIGGGTLFDIAVGARVWRSLSVGLAYSTIDNVNDAAVTVRVPHPLIFAQPRTASATAPELEHSENAVHLQFIWTIPLNEKIDLTAFAGPSFFTVRQTVASVQAPQDIADPAPFDNISIRNVSLTDVKDSPVGVNIGVDGTYWIRTIQGVGQAIGMDGIRIGVGGFLRYAGASLDLDVPAGITRDTELKTGGPQGGIGLRVRF